MKRRFTLTLLLLSAAWTEAGPPTVRPQSGDAQPFSRVNLGSTAGAPGTRLTVPVYFTPAPGVAAGRLNISVRYISNSLKFEKLQPALDADLAGIQFQGRATESRNEKGLNEQVLAITAVSGEKKQIPGGLLGYINYAVSGEGKAAAITLHASAEAFDLIDGAPVSPLKTFDAEVEVQLAGEPPAVICFFFTH